MFGYKANMKGELLQIFPTPILITKYEENISEETKYIENLEYTEQKNTRNYRSIKSNLFKHELLKRIKTFCEESITKYTETVLNSKQRLTITQCWTNKNPTGAIHHEHIHQNSIVSGVFFFRIGGKLPSIQFTKEVHSGMKLEPIKYNAITAETYSIPCMPGELLLFPSSLRHSVPINQSKETRYSMSFNTFGIGILGSEISATYLDIK